MSHLMTPCEERAELSSPSFDRVNSLSPEQEIPEDDARIKAIFSRPQEHPFQVLDYIFKSQRQKRDLCVTNMNSFYQKWPKTYNPLQEDVFVLSVNYHDQKKQMNKDLMKRLKARKKQNVAGKLRQFDNLKRDVASMTFSQLCKDQKAFYLYKRAGTSQAPGFRNYSQPLKKKQAEQAALKKAITKMSEKKLRATTSHKKNNSIPAVSLFSSASPRVAEDKRIETLKHNPSPSTSTQNFFHTRPKTNRVGFKDNQGDQTDRSRMTVRTRLPPLTPQNEPFGRVSFTPAPEDSDRHESKVTGKSQFNKKEEGTRVESRLSLSQERNELNTSKLLQESNYQKIRKEVAKNLLYGRKNKTSRTSRFNPQFLKPVPKLMSEEVQKTIKHFRDRKEEEELKEEAKEKKQMKKYQRKTLSLDTQESVSDISNSMILQLQSCPKRANRIIEKCNEVTPIEMLGNKDIDFELFKERVSMLNLYDTLDFLMPLESTDPLTLKRFYMNRQHVEVEEKQSIEEVSLEYRLGMMDPARDAARIERLNCIKKNVGKKKIMNELYDKLPPR